MNFKHMLRKGLLLLTASVGIAACSKEDTSTFLSVGKYDIEVEYTGMTLEGEMANFDLGTNTPWAVTYVEEWIHPSHMEGDRGRTRIFLSIDENNTGQDREGFVVFEGQDGTRQTVAVNQKLKVDLLSVSPVKMTVVRSGLLEDGEKASVYISTNCNWTIIPEEGSEWIVPAKTAGKPGNEAVVLNIEQNRTGAIRIGKFTVKGGSLETLVTITQNLEGLKISKTAFSVNKFGFADADKTPLTFTVTAAEAWTASGDSWLTLDKTSGEAGETAVILTVGENTSGQPRSGKVTVVTSSGLDADITVSQNAKSSLFDDDGKVVGYQYYADDFSWLTSAGGADCVGKKTQDGAKSVYSTAGVLDLFTNAGLEDINAAAKTIYACSDYFKFGKTDTQSGIILPALTIANGRDTNVELTFSTCPNIGGSGAVDKVTITVEVVEGTGTVDGDTLTESLPLTPKPEWAWTPMSVKVYGVTASTKIVIRSTQQGVKGLFRWYLDDVRMVKTAAE